MEMNPEIIVPLVIVVAGILIFALRKLSEVPAPKQPPVGASTSQEKPLVETQPDLVLITHPLIRRAAERALSQGGEAARYIVRDGDRIYFSFERIEDPLQRARAVELIKSIEEGGEMHVTELIQLVRRLLKT